MTDPASLSNTFGYQRVAEGERERRIRDVFQAVAPRYDLMNDLMSLGVHRLWKRRFARQAAVRDGELVVDLAGGTGDVAALMAGPGRCVVVVDPSEAMMQVGQARGLAHVQWQPGQAEALPFADASVDVLTIAFGIRNVTRLETALTEIHRVLKPGGRFLCLEFSTPARWLRPFYNLYSFMVIPRLGAWIARSPQAYTYLIESIRRFPDQEQFAALIASAGLEAVQVCNLSYGVAAIHAARRPVVTDAVRAEVQA